MINCDNALNSELVINKMGGALKLGDILSFTGVRWWPWYKWLWYHLYYMRHTNPMFKPAELRQFVVTGFGNETTAQITSRQ